MLTVCNLELKRTYIGGDYKKPKFETTAQLRIGERYAAKTTVTLTDEQTKKAVEFILGMIREGLTVEMEKPEPVEEPAPVVPAPVEAAPVVESFADNLTDGEPY
jgi:propanediol utilization protein